MAKSPFAQVAHQYLALGFAPLPRLVFTLPNGKKKAQPAVKGWSQFCLEAPSTDQINEWSRAYRGADLMLACGLGGLIVIDVDTNDDRVQLEVLRTLPQCRIARFGSKGFALLARHESGGPVKGRTVYSGEGAERRPMVEILSDGRNITVPPSIHTSGKAYIWFDPETGETWEHRPSLRKLPVITDADLDRLIEALKPWTSKPRERPALSPAQARRVEAGNKRLENYAKAQLQGAAKELSEMGADSGRNTALNIAAFKLGWALVPPYRVLTEYEIERALLTACEQNGLVRDDGERAVLATIQSGMVAGRQLCEPPELQDRPQRQGARAPRRLAAPGARAAAQLLIAGPGASPAIMGDGGVPAIQEPGPEGGGHGGNGHGGGGLNGNGHDAGEPDPEADPGLPPYAKDSLALRFAAKHKDELRYCKEWGEWLIFGGKYWRVDRSGEVPDFARELCREAASEVDDRAAKEILDLSTANAIEKAARVDRRIATLKAQWDANHWLVNTEAGTIDLRTGAMQPPAAGDHITKMTGVAPNDDINNPEGIPEWHKFLDTVLGGDHALKDYLQRCAGYWLTGSTKEHAIFFFYGTGANGKSTFLNTIAKAAGDYARNASASTFMETKTERHPTSIAALDGARLIIAPEVRDGRWNQELLTELSGGDRITARFMHKDEFSFIPQLKLVFSGNHKPALQSVDEAIKRRLHLIPFLIRIPEGERDKELMQKLEAELPGILAWMIEGCLHWQQIGLAPPKAVRTETEDYFKDEDFLAQWIEECCEKGPTCTVHKEVLWKSWTDYAERTGQNPRTSNWLGRKLGVMDGVTRSPDRRRYLGIKVLSDAEAEAKRAAAAGVKTDELPF